MGAMSETTTTTAPLIYSKIAAIIADLGAIEKSKNNKEQGFKYRGIDDVYNAIHPLFASTAYSPRRTSWSACRTSTSPRAAPHGSTW